MKQREKFIMPISLHFAFQKLKPRDLREREAILTWWLGPVKFTSDLEKFQESWEHPEFGDGPNGEC